MQLNKSYILGVFTLVSSSIYAQNTSYFQQKVDNVIHVTLDDKDHMLRGDINITYQNNSPDTLQYIYFHLWPNAYSNDRTAYNRQAVENGNTDFYTADKTDWGFIDSLHFKVSDNEVSLVSTNHVDVVQLILNEPLLPGATIEISTPFRVQIPKTFSRLGHHDQSYQITQWFPKPAVYDKNGWHPMPYLDQGEFYSEFGSYDVSITLPDNYVVMATGNMLNDSEIKYMDSLAALPITYLDSVDVDNIVSSNQQKTIRFVENNVHDFAWFADKKWIVRKLVFTTNESDEPITAWTAFQKNHRKGWENSTEFTAKAVAFYSSQIGQYPYKTVKAVEGSLMAGGGMEYPTVTIIIPSNDPSLIERVIAHEVGHNWFYGMLANNERIHPWLDESINSFYEEQHLLENDDEFISSIEYCFMQHNIKSGNSQPLNIPAEYYTDMNYGLDVYKKGSKYIHYLLSYMGAENFSAGIRHYFNNNKFQHVDIIDFRKSMELHTKKNLNWFFDTLINDNRPIDFAIKNVKFNDINNSAEVTILNKSSLQVPAIVDYIKTVDGEQQVHFKIIEPFSGFNKITLDNVNKTTLNYIYIDPSIPDVTTRDNLYNVSSNNSKFKFLPFIRLNNTSSNNIFYMLGMGLNGRDGYMLGPFIHNISLPSENLQFGIAPSYGFKSKKLVGSGFISYIDHFYNHSFFKDIEYKLSGKSYSLNTSNLNINNTVSNRFFTITPEVIFTFRNESARIPLTRYLSIKGYFIGEQDMKFTRDMNDSLYKPSLGAYQHQYFIKTSFYNINNRTYNPYGYQLEAQYHKDFVKLQAEAKLKIDYNYLNKGLHIRGFLGKILSLNNSADLYRYQFASTYSGWNDYLYDDIHMLRSGNNKFWHQQIGIKDGGLKIPSLMYANQLGLSDQWIGALNLEIDLPLKSIPVQLFADIATFTNASKKLPSTAKFLWDAGLQLNLGNVLKIYVPILYSEDYKDYLNGMYGNKKFINSITFSLQLNNINWSKPLETIPLLRSVFK